MEAHSEQLTVRSDRWKSTAVGTYAVPYVCATKQLADYKYIYIYIYTYIYVHHKHIHIHNIDVYISVLSRSMIIQIYIHMIIMGVYIDICYYWLQYVFTYVRHLFFVCIYIYMLLGFASFYRSLYT